MKKSTARGSRWTTVKWSLKSPDEAAFLGGPTADLPSSTVKLEAVGCLPGKEKQEPPGTVPQRLSHAAVLLGWATRPWQRRHLSAQFLPPKTHVLTRWAPCAPLGPLPLPPLLSGSLPWEATSQPESRLPSNQFILNAVTVPPKHLSKSCW